jgi:hypothetical protein
MNSQHPIIPVDINQNFRLGVLKNGVFCPPDHVLRNRPNKTAVGMTKTLYRSHHVTSNEACKLSVKGTLDRLTASWLLIRRDRQTNKYRLTDAGRKRLARLRRLRIVTE